MCKAKRIRISEFIREHNFTKENLETFLAILKCGLPFLCFQDYKRYKEYLHQRKLKFNVFLINDFTICDNSRK